MTPSINLRILALLMYISGLSIGIAVVVSRGDLAALQSIVVTLATIVRLLDELRRDSSQK